MSLEEKKQPSPDLTTRLAVLSAETRALLGRRLGAVAPIAVSNRAAPAPDCRCLALSIAQQLRQRDSLLAIRVIGRLNETLLVSLSIRGLFENPVVADLVRAVALARPAGDRSYPLSIPGCLARRRYPRMAVAQARQSSGFPKKSRAATCPRFLRYQII
jgi:hypothetical protein